MIEVSLGGTAILIATEPLHLMDHLRGHADLVEEHGLDEPGDYLFVGAGPQSEWSSLVVVQRYAPGPAAGFRPGVLLVPETNVLFLGAGRRVLVYDLDGPVRVSRDSVGFGSGFWGWARHGNRVVMSAELDLAAWTLEGEKVWSRGVEPPWSFRVEGHTIEVDVMGEVETLDLRSGGPA